MHESYPTPRMVQRPVQFCPQSRWRNSGTAAEQWEPTRLTECFSLDLGILRTQIHGFSQNFRAILKRLLKLSVKCGRQYASARVKGCVSLSFMVPKTPGRSIQKLLPPPWTVLPPPFFLNNKPSCGVSDTEQHSCHPLQLEGREATGPRRFLNMTRTPNPHLPDQAALFCENNLLADRFGPNQGSYAQNRPSQSTLAFWDPLPGPCLHINSK
ncbi:hypothetical protein C8R47DRAFT_380672 [Mycena vitilis]|nr:hypothetical protein C8R47DRAFT_380672 [Mycena vitilis]